MGTKHLSNDQIARSAESIILNGSVNFSTLIKNHLEECMSCSVQVQVKLDSLNTKYRDRINDNLTHDGKTPLQVGIWVGIAASIVFMIALGVMASH